MALGHPVDDRGRVLPDSAWPRDRAAPEHWDVIRRFCNTCNHESGADRFETDDGLLHWLDSEEIPGRVTDPGERRRIVEFREHVRAHACAHGDGTDDADLVAALADHVADVELGLVVRNGRLVVVPAPVSVVNQAIGTVTVAIMSAQRENGWSRFKACRHCDWVFYDRSKNQSGRWCSMNACGGRAKVAAFRAREKDANS